MGKCKRKQTRKKKKSNWSWKNNQKTTFTSKHRKTEKAITKVQKKPLNKLDLLKLLKNIPNFLGVHSSDELSNLCVVKYPIYLIVNIDTSQLDGSHWLAIHIDKRSVEVFDSLGMNPSLWGSYPSPLFDFLGNYSFSHKFHISPLIQPPYTFTCGLYCIYFIIFRQKFSFRYCTGQFSSLLSENNQKLFSLLLKN